MSLIVPFPGALTAQLSKVGGKGQSLIRMTQLGLPVPPGFVLTVEFFEPWMNELKLTDEWNNFVHSGGKNLKEICDALKARAGKLEFSKEQQQMVEDALKPFDGNDLFAVRSSSPAEDLEGSSFAGGYETVLGVKRKDIEIAARQAFSSSLDFRVLTYKHQHGFDIHDPSIAVVVQKQINSTSSGVAFSINPINNDYDEAVFNANFGLGESVVAGLCTPDTIIVDKVTMRVKERRLGAKEEQIFLKEGGGTSTVTGGNGTSEEFAISDGHVLNITRYIKTLEEIFRQPVDVEWALEGDHEYILQARPVTSYVPLPPSLITAPAAKRRLYLDLTLSVQGFEKPISVMGTSFLRRLLKTFTSEVFGLNFVRDVDHSVAYATDGRLYGVISNLFQLFDKNRFANFFKILDPLAAQAIAGLDEKDYKGFHPWALSIPASLGIGMIRKSSLVLKARAFPERAHMEAQRQIALYREQLQKEAHSKGTVKQALDRIMSRMVHMVPKYIMPMMFASRWALERMKHYCEGVPPELQKALEVGMPHNVTIEMGLELYRLSTMLPANVKQGAEMKDVKLSDDFKHNWDLFMKLYGHRGARELDIMEPRYRDEPQILFDQIVTLRRSSNNENNPLKRYEKNRGQRDHAYLEICEYLGKIDDKQLRRFKSMYNTWETLGGYRETPKYCLILALDAFRQRLLVEGQKLVDDGRLDSVEQVFDLTLDDFDTKVPNKKIDLREVCHENRKVPDKLAKVPKLPALIDSRGRILRAPTPVPTEGEVIGTPISSGVAMGPIKILNTPDEKPLNYGDVLVARATDPGWTPLFVNASAVILEVGGLLQHGALVAREYGLPCVGGVTGATTLWEDGTQVEVDGSRGIIRIVN